MPIVHDRNLTLNTTATSCLRKAARLACASLLMLMLMLISLLWSTRAAAQGTCPAPWNNAANVYGIVLMEGTGNGSSGDLKQSVNQQAVAQGKLAAFPGACLWEAIPLIGFGQMKSFGQENDTIIDTQKPDNNLSWNASGIGDPMWDSLTLQILPASSQYNVGAFGAVPGTFTNYQGTVNEDIIWGSQFGDGGVSQQGIPFPPSAPFLFGTASFALPPFDNAQGNPGTINANWTETWMFSPIPDGTCKDCQDRRGSAVSIRNQSLGEDIPIIGTGFFLHYESGRAPGRAGGDPVATRDALSLGGWTLNVHHALEPLLMVYCAGGSCTPYSIVPKALFLGDGTVRNSADVQAPLIVGSNLQLTSEDGSEIYVFDGTSAKHVQTLAPLTGAVIYSFGYDANGFLVTVTDGSGNVTTIHRDGNEHPTAIVSPFGQTTSLTVDANGYLSQVTDPMGHAIKLTTSPLGLLSSFNDANGNLYSFQYDTNGFLTRDSDPAGGVLNLAITNNSNGFSVTETTAQGRINKSAVAFSNTGSSTTQTITNTWPNGLQAAETDMQQNGQLVQSGFLPNGMSFTKTIGPDPRWGIQLPITTSETLTAGNLTMTIANSRALSLSNPADPFSVITQTDTQSINGRTYQSVFTGATGTLVEKSAGGRTTTSVLDSLQRVISTQNTGMALTNFSYDNLGRMSSVTEGTRNTTFSYDSNGRLATVTNPVSLSRSFSYDADGNLLAVAMEDGRIVNYTYDANGNLTSVTPPGGTAHAFAYSAVNEPSSYVPPVVAGGGATTYSFSPDRQLTKMTRPDGQTINYNYDSAGRMISIAAPSTTIGFSFDPVTGNRSSATVSGEVTGYSYNGSLPTASSWTGLVEGSIGRSFDNNFWVTSETIDGGNNVAFTYDKDGLVSKAGLLTLKNNAKTGLYTGSSLGLLKDTLTYNTSAEPDAYTAKLGTSILYKATYTRDDIGRITTLKETIGAVTTSLSYLYDAAGRLTSVASVKGKKKVTLSSYSYDGNSNRAQATTPSGTVTGTYDAQDRQLTYGDASYTYTANGELATKTVGSQMTTYQYDSFGNLTAVTLPNNSHIAYILDAEGNRVGRNVNGAVTGYIYDGGNLVAQLDANNQIVSQFIYGTGTTSPDYMLSGGIAYRIVPDHLGSPRLVVNSATGQVVERLDYDEFGNVINDTNPGFQPFGFAGGLNDPDTKIVHFGARDYDPSTGRWITIDPILFSGSDSNLYGYVMNDPVNLADPTGLSVWICRDGNNIMIIFGINFTGPGASPGVIKGMSQAIESRWSGKFGPYSVHTSVVNTTGELANVVNVHSDNGRGSQYLGGTGKGDWHLNTDVGHEAGHILGLRDRYVDLQTKGGLSYLTDNRWKGNVMGQRFGKVDGRNIREILKNFPVCPCH